MSDALGSLTSGTQASKSYQNQSDLLVESYKKTRQPDLDALTNKKNTLQQKQAFFTTLKSKLDALIDDIDSFTASNSASKFVTRNITSSNTNVLSVSAKSTAALGSNAIKVNRLASNDQLYSKQLNLSEAYGASITGTKSFDISVNGTSKTVQVTFNGDETNEAAMTKIAAAINSTTDIKVTASFIKDTKTTGRLTLTSKTTGSDNNIQFSESLDEADPNNRVLGRLGLISADLQSGTTTRTALSGTSAGYKLSDYNNLDSQIEVNGLTVTRSSNSIDDVLTGVTLNLLKPQDNGELPVTLQANIDTDAVKNLIKPLLDSYNDILSYVKQNPDQMRSDSTVSSLYSKLRADASEGVSSAAIGNPKFLMDIGIKIASDGTLSLSDTTKLTNALKDNPQKVSDLFTSSDGLASKLTNSIANLSGEKGIIKSRTLSLSTQIDSVDKRYNDLSDKIDLQADSLRKEYESMLRVMMDAQNQYTFLNGGTTLTGSSSY